MEDPRKGVEDLRNYQKKKRSGVRFCDLYYFACLPSNLSSKMISEWIEERRWNVSRKKSRSFCLGSGGTPERVVSAIYDPTECETYKCLETDVYKEKMHVNAPCHALNYRCLLHLCNERDVVAAACLGI